MRYFAIRSTPRADRIMDALGHGAYRSQRPEWGLPLFVLWAVLFCAIPLVFAAAVRKWGLRMFGTPRRDAVFFGLAIVYLAVFMYAGETVHLTFPAGEEDAYLVWSDHFQRVQNVPARIIDGQKVINGDEDEVRNMVVADFIAKHGVDGFRDAWQDVPKTEMIGKYLRWGTRQHPPLYFLTLAAGFRIGGIRCARWMQFLTSVAFLAVIAGALRAHGFPLCVLSPLLLFAMPGMVVYEFSKAGSDVFVGVLVTCSVWCLAYLSGRRRLLWAASAGVALGIAMWSKYTALVAVGAVVLLVLLGIPSVRFGKRLLCVLVMLLAAAVVVAPLVIWLWDTPIGMAQWNETLGPMFRRSFARVVTPDQAMPVRSSVGVTLRNFPRVLAVDWGIPFCLLVGMGAVASLWRVWRRPELRYPILGALVFLVVTWGATLAQNPLWRYTIPAMWALVAVAANGLSSVVTDRGAKAAFIAHLVLFALTKELLYLLEYRPVL